jgi:hypothetical protein
MSASTGGRLVKHWRSRSAVSLMPPVTAAEVKAFEEQYMVRLPDEVREYYRAANGFAPANDQDENGFSFWPLTRVCPVKTFDGGRWSSEDTEDCFVFADYLSLSWGYAFRLTSDPVRAAVCIVGTASRRPRWIADSFLEFVELYVREDQRLYSANEPGL